MFLGRGVDAAVNTVTPRRPAFQRARPLTVWPARTPAARGYHRTRWSPGACLQHKGGGLRQVVRKSAKAHTSGYTTPRHRAVCLGLGGGGPASQHPEAHPPPSCLYTV